VSDGEDGEVRVVGSREVEEREEEEKGKVPTTGLEGSGWLRGRKGKH
jgi:hypothetical protein